MCWKLDGTRIYQIIQLFTSFDLRAGITNDYTGFFGTFSKVLMKQEFTLLYSHSHFSFSGSKIGRWSCHQMAMTVT